MPKCRYCGNETEKDPCLDCITKILKSPTDNLINGDQRLNNEFIKNRIGIIKKIKYILGAWLLAEIVLKSPVLTFIDRLNIKKIINIGEDFSPTQIIWGVNLLPNIMKVIIVILFAGIFGLIFGYKTKKLTYFERIIFSFVNSLVDIFGLFIIMILILIIRFPYKRAEVLSGLALAIKTISSSTFCIVFLSCQIIGSILIGCYAINIGNKIAINNKSNIVQIDSKKSAFLGIKWYHYCWLWLPINGYFLIFLNLIYQTIITFITLIKNIKLLDFLKIGKSNIDIAWGKLFFIYILGAIAISSLNYLWKVLVGEKKLKMGIKVLLCFTIGIVLPILMVMFHSI